MADITYGGNVDYIKDSAGNYVLDASGQRILAADSGFGFTQFFLGLEITGKGVVGKVYNASTLLLGLSVSGQGSVSPFTPPIAANVTYDAQGYVNGYKQPPLTIGFEVTGNVFNVVNFGTPLLLGFELTGQGVVGKVYQAGDIDLGLSVSGIPVITPGMVTPDPTVTYLANWIWTSHIGSFDFTYDDTGEVRKFPLSWGGTIYAIKKLGNVGVVAYGENGVTLCHPHETFWGKRDILKIGIMGRGAVCVRENDEEHFFIDKTGLFWRLPAGAQPKATDYSTYFSALNSNVVMSYNYLDDTIHIADGVLGFIWSEWGLGQAPPNISGAGTKYGTLYMVGPSSIITDPFNICTDIQDFGVRTDKTISQFDMGIALQGEAWGAVDYRWRTNDPWFTSPWTKADRNGRFWVEVSGVEFRFRIKLTTWEDIQLDYGSIHVKYDESKPISRGPVQLTESVQ